MAQSPKYFVYMLHCADGTIYSGYAADPHKRAGVHNSGRGAKYTRSRLPVTLVYYESCLTKSEALHKEAALKKLTHKQKEKLIKQNKID